jgi:hypothetical protein
MRKPTQNAGPAAPQGGPGSHSGHFKIAENCLTCWWRRVSNVGALAVNLSEAIAKLAIGVPHSPSADEIWLRKEGWTPRTDPLARVLPTLGFSHLAHSFCFLIIVPNTSGTRHPALMAGSLKIINLVSRSSWTMVSDIQSSAFMLKCHSGYRCPLTCRYESLLAWCSHERIPTIKNVVRFVTDR